MKLKARSDGLWAVLSQDSREEGRLRTVALLPTRAAAEAVVGKWEADQEEASASWLSTLRRWGMTPYGRGMEVALDEALVLRLGGRLI